jgi:hypothetical protein
MRGAAKRSTSTSGETALGSHGNLTSVLNNPRLEPELVLASGCVSCAMLRWSLAFDQPISAS